MKAARRELAVQISIGIILILVGILLTLVPYNKNHSDQKAGEADAVPEFKNASKEPERHSDWIGILHHIGTAILTCGMLMVTVELYTKYREARVQAKLRAEQERYITHIREVQSDALLSELLPDKAIFKQIKSEIIQQPFIRRNMEAIVHLRWADSSRSAIRKVLSLSYDVENTSTIAGTAPIRMRLVLESPNDIESRIESLQIGSRDGKLVLKVPNNQPSIVIENGVPQIFTEAELQKHGIVKKEVCDLQVFLELELESRQTAQISYKQKTVEKCSDDCHILCTLPTIGLEVHVNPPAGICIDHAFLHPSGRVIRDDEDETHLVIEGAVLPYQGIAFSWQPKDPSHVPCASTGGVILASEKMTDSPIV